MRSKQNQSAASNPAVLRCCKAWEKAFDENYDELDETNLDAHQAANCAYREAMPPPCGVRNIRNFIACVTHGLSYGAIDGRDCSRYLYAAQVAFTTRRQRPRKPKASSSPAQNDHSGAIQPQEKAIQEPSSDRLTAAQMPPPQALANVVARRPA